MNPFFPRAPTSQAEDLIAAILYNPKRGDRKAPRFYSNLYPPSGMHGPVMVIVERTVKGPIERRQFEYTLQDMMNGKLLDLMVADAKAAAGELGVEPPVFRIGTKSRLRFVR